MRRYHAWFDERVGRQSSLSRVLVELIDRREMSGELRLEPLRMNQPGGGDELDRVDVNSPRNLRGVKSVEDRLRVVVCREIPGWTVENHPRRRCGVGEGPVRVRL